jgi:regulator of RNase E activity RraA
MTDKPLSAAECEALKALDTPTVCNALEELIPERRSSGFTTRTLICPFPDMPPMVGYARTGTIRSVTPARRNPAEQQSARLGYYEYVGAGAVPKISVIQDLDDEQAGFGAFWGEVNSTIHRALGCEGLVTNGSVRDLHVIAPNFAILAGAIGPSHAHVHVVDFNCEVNVKGMVVRSDDLIHADRHGAVVIPHAVARRVVEAADKCARREAVILEACRRPDFSYAVLKQALQDASKYH